MAPPSLRSPLVSLKSSVLRLGVRTGLSPFSSPPWFLLLLLLLTCISPSCSSSPGGISYASHCNSTVPEATPAGLLGDSSTSFQIPNGYYSGGGRLLGSFPESFGFRAKSLHQTQTPGVLQVDGTLVFNGRRGVDYYPNGTDSRYIRHRNSTARREAIFQLSGFWSESAGKLCMVGRGFLRRKRVGTSMDLSAVLKLNYPDSSNISTSMANGTVESLDEAQSPNHFDPISILAYAQKNYEYTMISQANESCSHIKFEEELVGFNPGTVCSNLQPFLDRPFILDTGSSCSSGNCDPFGKGPRIFPGFMFFKPIQCSDGGRMHFQIGFSNDTMAANDRILVPDKSLVGEGFWDQSENRLCLMACRILDAKGSSLANASVGDCTIGLSLGFPAFWSISIRSTTIGRIWSGKNKNDAGYFSMVSFRSLQDGVDPIPGLKYEYTKLVAVKKYCVENNVTKLGKWRYPNGRYFDDMRFSLSLRDVNGNDAWGQATPVFIGETYHGNDDSVMTNSGMNHTLWNVSYELSYTFWNASSVVDEPTVTTAEGIYNAETGMLCMVGCRYPISSVARKQANGAASDSMDCEILINLQLPPLDPRAGEHFNGTIRSLREKSDPLFFDPLQVSSSSIYRIQTAEISWRMDIEIIMVLISLTLSCFFIRMQIYHVKKHPDVLPSISILMLVILALGYMVPLFLNFEAFFEHHNRYSILLWRGGWLEVIVRVMTMVAFLLECRLLQLAWSSRSAEDGKKGLSVPERTALMLCLPLYFAGGLIACFVHVSSRRHSYAISYHRHSLWEDLISYSGNLISYAGLVLDGFLLPQVILNIFGNSKDKALTPFFYVGTTAVRALPHLYDAYRAHHFFPQLVSSYIYASPDEDFYSSAWDIIIPCGGLLFAMLIYLQQRYGGGCILPARFRRPGHMYEMVSMVSL
ncbi:uncharacterized protein LOC103702592 [Phoenix dactylifera]|uniref:RING-type E3 ubiquitin transferase n=1 Tax=Phoenix dactylifera TaxID=42345 RepID=A0A8B8J234_PHODC|nr:uncharacterized protein LOC103702592 [Phoenix dactylifera]